MNLEKLLERVKIDLALRTDFNLIDAFRVFDESGCGFVEPRDIVAGLKIF